jgi:hypothetical protein
LVSWLTAKHGIPPDRIAGHNELAATDCPGRNMKAHIQSLKKRDKALNPNLARDWRVLPNRRPFFDRMTHPTIS